MRSFVPFYGKKEWEVLDGTWIGAELKKRCDSLDKNYSFTQKMAPDIFNHPVEVFKKAFMIYQSRGYNLQEYRS